MNRRGFTLLEVMVAITILGLGLTMILSAQTGLFASARRVQTDTVVSNLMRCKMSEIELELEVRGFSLLDEFDTGDCCEDTEEPGYVCEWKIETVELPSPDALLDADGDGLPDDEAKETEKLDSETDASVTTDSGEKPTSSSKSSSSPPLGSLGLMSGLESGSVSLPEGSGTDGLASALGAGSSGGPMGMVSMAMTLVYPNLKPMLEASIRKVTVLIRWEEGRVSRNFVAVQYITNPLEGSLNPNAAQGLDQLVGSMGVDGGLPGGRSTGTTPGATK